MRRIALVVAPIVALLAVGSAQVSVAKVETSHKPETDFSRYRTYAWEEHPGLQAHHPLAQGSDLDRLIREAADAALKKKGFEKLEGPERGEPDFTVNFVAFVADELEIEGVSIEIAPRVTWIGDPDEHSQRSHQRGTLVVEIRDRESGEIVWSGWSQDAAPTVVRLRKKAASTVKKILAHFPPRR